MDKYKTIKSVGRGSYGAVYLYLRKSDQRQVVIKQITLDSITTSETEASHNEIRILSMLNHPFIIQYHESFLWDSAMMIVMEYAPGGNLHSYLQSRQPDNLLDEMTVINMFSQLVLGLEHIHKHKILHRDLKTHNILLDKHRRNLKIGDFGISKILASKSKAHTVVGTPCYLSPELCLGRPYNRKSDIWALGCILYELCTLTRAFHAETIPALIKEITKGKFPPLSPRYSPHTTALVSGLLHLEPRKRPDTNEILADPAIFSTALKIELNVGIILPDGGD